MGRAIVRHPQAFLMDEPLSNLDAKLRVQMRSEIAAHPAATSASRRIYVTHDQIEAMTMGDRVAVMRKGELQQVDSPQTLYEHPMNLFVAGFIGSPAMNLFEANLDPTATAHSVVEFGGFRLPLPPGGRSQPGRALAAYEGARSCSASGPKTWRTRRSSPTHRPTAASASTVELQRGAGLRRARALHGARDRRRSPTT